MHKIFRVAATIVVAALGTVVYSAASSAQGVSSKKALVYCPTSDDVGCKNIAGALSDGSFSVDRGFDGTSETVNLATVDLAQYAVIVIPSLADDAEESPYALLRDPAIAARLKAVVGRAAVWSGTPDLGTPSADTKDVLLRNLTRWGANGSSTVKSTGLVVLQDNCEDAARRYTWLTPIVGFTVRADTTLRMFESVVPLTDAAKEILSNGGQPLAYVNMASFGVFVSGTEATVAARGEIGGPAVLITWTAAGGGVATVRTDRDDYPPGDTVAITGSGWEPGEVVTLTLVEVPKVHDDRNFTAIADSAGNILNTEFSPEEHHIGVQFTLTATGQTSGRTAQTTFTDGTLSVRSLEIRTGDCATAQGSFAQGAAVCASTVLIFAGTGNTNYSVRWYAPDETQMQSTGGMRSGSGEILYTPTYTLPTNAPIGTWKVRVCESNVNATQCNPERGLTTFDVTAAAIKTTTTVTSSANPSKYGQSVTFTAKVTADNNSTPSGSVQFYIDMSPAGPLMTLSGGSATYTTAALGVGTHQVKAVYTPSSGYGPSDGTLTGGQRVDKAGTVTAVATSNSPSRVGESVTFTASVSVAAPGAGAPTGTVQFYVDGEISGGLVPLTGGTATYSISTLAAGGHAIRATYAGDFNFDGSSGTLVPDQQVNRIATVLAPAAASGTYGGTTDLSATLTANGNGIAGQTISFALNGTTVGTAVTNPAGVATISAVSLAGIDVGQYANGVSASYAESDDYSKAIGTNSLTIDKAIPSFADLASPEITYGTQTATFSGKIAAGLLIPSGEVKVTVAAVGMPLFASSTIASDGSFAATIVTATLSAASSSYDVRYEFEGNENFERADGYGKLTVKRADQTIIFNSLSDRTYGDPDFALSATGGESKQPVTFALGQGSVGCSLRVDNTVAITGATPPGQYCIIVASQAGDGNYNPAPPVSQQFTIAKKYLLLTANSLSPTYGITLTAILPEFTVTSPDWVNGDNLGSLDASGASFTITDAPGTGYIPVKQGGYEVMPSGYASANYDIHYAPGRLTIEPKALTITAEDKSKTYDGQVFTGFTVRYGEFVPDEDENVLIGDPSFSGPAVSEKDAGRYEIKPEGLTSSNYAITFLSGWLTIAKKDLLLKASSPTRTYGVTLADILPALTVSSSDFVPGEGLADLNSSAASITITGAPSTGYIPVKQGGYPVVAIGYESNNYRISYAPGTLSIDPAELIAKIRDATKIRGAANPPFAVIYEGFVTNENELLVSGTPNISTAANDNSAEGDYPITWESPIGISAPNYVIKPLGGTLTITPNAPPVLGAVTGPIDPVMLGAPITISASFSDADVSASQPYATSIDWGDNTAPSASTRSEPGTFSGSHTYAATGVYTITVTVSDKIPLSSHTVSAQYQYKIVIYDPNGGFVTGGGWINSPSGACQLTSVCQNATGKANFGFVSKYQKGATAPTGNTEFQFQAGNLNFKSTSYDWLVISGSKAQYQGTGTINGKGSYTFKLTAIDGKLKGKGESDRFRMQIWNSGSGGGLVYDNQVGASDTADPVTALGGGSVVIHQ